MTAVEIDEVATSPSNANTPLTPTETELLEKCEETIGKGLKTFNDVADALQDVRDQSLYRVEYATFEDYCRKRWKITARHANRLMLAGACVENLKSDQLVSNEPIAIPDSESSARPLANLTPPQQITAARIAAKKSDKPTAKQFKEAAKEVVGEKTKEAKSTKTSNAKAPDNGDLEKLLELVDAAQTQAKKIKDGADLAKMLGDVAKAVTRRLNGGAK